MNYSRYFRQWLIWTLLAALTVAGGSFSVLSTSSGGNHRINGPNLPEQWVTNLPDGDEVIQKINRIIHPTRGTMKLKLNWLERAIGWVKELLEKIIKKFKALLYPELKDKNVAWQGLLRWMVIPFIIAVIVFIGYLLGSRIRRDVREDTTRRRTAEAAWRTLFRRALDIYPSAPGEAVHLLVKAVIRSWAMEGKIKDDPALTLREIERRLLGQLGHDQKEAFSALRHRYERVVYGRHPVEKEDWQEVLQLAGVFLGEVPETP